MRSELTFLHCGHNPRCVATVDKRFDYHAMQFMTRGGVDLWYDREAHQLRGAWLWSCGPGPHVRFHEAPRGKPWHHRYVAFQGPLTAQWRAAGLLLTKPEPVEPGDLRPTAARFDQLLQQASGAGRWARLRAINHLEALLIDRAERRATAAPGALPPGGPPGELPGAPDWLGAVLDRLQDWSAEPDYDQLAREHRTSLPTLRRRFQKATGTPLHTYRLDARIAEARRRLGETDTPIKRIADDLGYRDVFYFTRQFTKSVGVSPGAYRQSRQG